MMRPQSKNNAIKSAGTIGTSNNRLHTIVSVCENG